METVRIQSNDTERVYFILLDSSGNPVTGLTGAQLNMLTLMRKSDGQYWSGSAWQASKTDLAVTEKDAANSPGLYYYTTPSLAEDEYVITVSTANATNVPQMGIIKAGYYVDDIAPGITQQQVRDAMKLAPSGGEPASLSIDNHLDDILDDTGTSGVKVADKSNYSILGTKQTLDSLNDIAASDVWSAVTRTLTAGTKDAEIDAIQANITRILGLSGENIVWDDAVYDANDKMTSATGYLYNSKANAQTHDKTTGLVGKYTITATITGGNTTLSKRYKES